MSKPFVNKGFVFDIDSDLLPIYRLNPFDNRFVKYKEGVRVNTSNVDNSVAEHITKKPFVYTANGRQAIDEALKRINLDRADCVTILTSTGNKYISACVTNQISMHCSWSRIIENNTKAIFVNHEFGVPYHGVDELKRFGLPIIEDCCYSYASSTIDNKIGQIGDFVIYSFAKYFPMQMGGVLAGNSVAGGHLVDDETLHYLRTSLAVFHNDIELISDKRRENHRKLSLVLKDIGIVDRFKFISKNDGVPGVFMFKAPEVWNLVELKEFMWSCGIHCSVFYGEHSFFIPVHQNIDDIAIEYFYKCLKLFSKKNDDII
ncbi:DegT/DnrJ/EryC1/StrS family aminotransferase [Hymenobacter actinosclerus]|uniref:DegT/DnrJ/EryC1/StrS aminotransferase family protein n=1 Tax=Hymenobacter actinosclerus TaxID=82805 RepID=A0A1I0GZ22_9BACT|nr:DegT/DnrJ/EryC1/StrS family aminotransferase [Hymenobacter actinosclerus]SET75798.1 DegT/DnrJ/EryC1/StrS aminotransferase family protein [Hymenobacter actinosclerus]